MSKSPGHREHPEHEVREQHLTERIRASVGGELLAESTDVEHRELAGRLAFYDDKIRDIEVRPKP
jgi:hypothetical protein